MLIRLLHPSQQLRCEPASPTLMNKAPDLKRNFDDLSTGVEVRSLTIKDSEARMSKLSDGGIMLERPSSEGSPTLELKRPKGSKDIKFRYKG